MNLPIFKEDSDETITSDSNYNASAAKIAFKKNMRTTKRNESFDLLINDCGGLPEINEAVLIKTNGCSDTGSIYKHISNKENLNELYLSTWIINRQNIDMICDDIDSGKLKKLYFVVSTRLKQLKKSNYAYLIEQYKKRQDKIKLKVCNSHAKTFSISTENGNYYTVTGSGNWTENPRIENYIILNDKQAFNHNKEWMQEVLK